MLDVKILGYSRTESQPQLQVGRPHHIGKKLPRDLQFRGVKSTLPRRSHGHIDNAKGTRQERTLQQKITCRESFEVHQDFSVPQTDGYNMVLLRSIPMIDKQLLYDRGRCASVVL